MLWWVVTPGNALSDLQHGVLVKLLVFLNVVMLIGWLKYREHLFRDTKRQGIEQWLFYLLAAMGVAWIATASLANHFLEAINRDKPVMGLLIRTTAALILVSYMWLWGHVKREPDLDPGNAAKSL